MSSPPLSLLIGRTTTAQAAEKELGPLAESYTSYWHLYLRPRGAAVAPERRDAFQMHIPPYVMETRSQTKHPIPFAESAIRAIRRKKTTNPGGATTR